jgi:hypothetical protein
MRRSTQRRNYHDNQQCIAIRYFPGFSRGKYLSALFRQIRDLNNGLLRDIESDDTPGYRRADKRSIQNGN